MSWSTYGSCLKRLVPDEQEVSLLPKKDFMGEQTLVCYSSEGAEV